jgi:hypothetical protein
MKPNKGAKAPATSVAPALAGWLSTKPSARVAKKHRPTGGRPYGKSNGQEKPNWFVVNRYSSAMSLDAADWYLNLELRGEIARRKDNELITLVRGELPIVRRDAYPLYALGLLEQMPGNRNPNFLRVLNGELPIEPVRNVLVKEFYHFERRINPDLREASKSFDDARHELPSEFNESVNEHFDIAYSGVFARINLSVPDDEIVESLKRYLAQERVRMRKHAPTSAQVRALDSLRKRNIPKLGTWAVRGLLPYLDLHQWAKETQPKPTDEQIAEWLGLSAQQLKDTKIDAKLVLNQFALHGWIFPRIRDESRAK